jgi:hypothetical protein
MALGLDAVSLSEVPVVDPEQVQGAFGTPLEGTIGADGIEEIGVDRLVATVREGRGDEHVRPAVLERVRDLDVGRLFQPCRDQAQGHAPGLDEDAIQLCGFVDPRRLDLDAGEPQRAELAPGIERRELVTRPVAARQVDQASAHPADRHVRVAAVPGVCDDRDELIVRQGEVAVDRVYLLAVGDVAVPGLRREADQIGGLGGRRRDDEHQHGTCDEDRGARHR